MSIVVTQVKVGIKKIQVFKDSKLILETGIATNTFYSSQTILIYKVLQIVIEWRREAQESLKIKS